MYVAFLKNKRRGVKKGDKNCWALGSADLSGWSSKRLVHAKGMFHRCAALKSVVLGVCFSRVPAHMRRG